MKKFKNQPVTQYLDGLASRDPVPGGGSAAALTAALGVGLMAKAARYSLGRSKARKDEACIKAILKKSEKMQKRLLTLVDLDAQAYLKVVKTRQGTLKQKKDALSGARAVPAEVCRISYAAIDLMPVLIAKGNPYLLSDVLCAAEMLLAGFRSAAINVEVNQIQKKIT